MIPSWYINYKNLIEDSISSYLDSYFLVEKNPALQEIKEATIYSTKWWKRIRSILALEFFLIISWKKIEEISIDSDIMKFCIALELLHSYSLVHDDLPAMDNDDYRRWELTTWKKYWDANAVLVWDLLNSLSFEVLSDIWNIALIKLFWKSVWLNWMLGWQVLDLYYENNFNELTLDNLIETHNKKTWALIEVSIIWWLILWNLTLKPTFKYKKDDLSIYSDFWKKIGLAFQVKDDLLDVEWTFEETWKSVWDWEEKGFVFFIWLEKTKEYLDELINDCFIITKNLNSEKLNFIINYVKNRSK